MEVLFVIGFVWAMITVAGHGTWVLIRWIFASLSGDQVFPSSDGLRTNSTAKPSPTFDFSNQTKPPELSSHPDPQNDLIAFTRMLEALESENRLSVDEGAELQRKAQSLVANWNALAESKSPILDGPPLFDGPPRFDGPTLDNTLTDELEIVDWSPDRDSGEIAPAFDTTDDLRENHQSIPAVPSTPKQAFSEVLSSFLAQHNIRWGELIAGILIVVCSIGLVLSLWSTLTSAHRIVPAVVFMSADAAIFAAGLYTMRRWKLRHTSRAVLIIATLLVPLCVLAGLAAAGANAESVSLTDPVTVGVVVLATVSCGWLLWHACVALVGRVTAGPVMASVVSSSLTLPLLPAASRWLGAGSGWVVIVPAIVTAVSFLIRQERCQSHGRRIWKNQWLHLGIAVSSFASVIVYSAFLFQAGGRETWIQIAIATVPVWVSIAMVFGARAIRLGRAQAVLTKPNATRRLISSVVAVIAVGLCVAIVPASIERVSWLWLHAITAGISTGLVGWWIDRRGGIDRVAWGVAAAMPLGFTGMMTSPVWLAKQSWSSVAIHRMALGGEPMMVSIGMLVIGIAAWVILRKRSSSSFSSQALLGWTGLWGVFVAGQSLVLSWAPTSWLGMMPIGMVGVVLAAIVIVAGFLASIRAIAAMPNLPAIVAAIAGVSLATLIGGRELWLLASWQTSGTLWTLGMIMGLIGVVWLAIDEAVKRRPSSNSSASQSAENSSTVSDGDLTVQFLTVATGLFGLATLWQAASVMAGPLTAELSRVSQWIALPNSSLKTASLHGLSLVVLGAACVLADRINLIRCYAKLISAVGLVVGLFLSSTLSIYLTDSPQWQLVVMTTLACGTLAAVHWKYPSRPLAIGIAGVVVTGSLVLLRESWWLPIRGDESPVSWICVSMAVWWLAGSVLLARTRVDWKRGASAVIAALTVGMLTPVFFNTSPIVWFQATALGSLIWLLADRGWAYLVSLQRLDTNEASEHRVNTYWRSGTRQEFRSPRKTKVLTTSATSNVLTGCSRDAKYSVAWVRFVGFASVAGLFAGIIMQESWAASWSLPIGWLMTMLALGSFAVPAFGVQSSGKSAGGGWRHLPLAVPIMSGHLACLGILAGWITRGDVWLVVAVCGLIGSVGSAILVWWKRFPIHSWHVTIQAGLIFGLAVAQGGSLGWLAMAGLIVAAVALMRFEEGIHSRGLSWLVLIGGIYLILFGPSELGPNSLTWLMAWTGLCVVIWRSDRIFSIDSLHHQRADLEASALLLPMLGWGILQAMDSTQWQSALTVETSITHHFYRAAIAVMAGASGLFGLWGSPQRSKHDLDPNRFGSRALWRSSQWLGLGSVVLIGVTVATIFDATPALKWMIAGLSSMFAIAIISWIASRHANNAIGLAIERVTMVMVALGSLIGIGLSLDFDWRVASNETLAMWSRLSFLGIGFLTWTLFGLAEQTRPADGNLARRRRNRTIETGLWMVAVLAVFGVGTTSSVVSGEMLFLIASMRLLIVSILSIGLLLLVIPKFLAGSFIDRWQSSLRLGGRIAAVTAIGALASMLALEAILRQRGFGIEGLPMPTVILVGFMLAGLAGMAGVIAVLSGPGFDLSRKAHWLQISDPKRKGLLYASQGIAFLTWLHLFLCRTEIAHLGLRPYWPYIVMVLAFVSVGFTQWAIRRGDQVIADAMKRTAMYLPLIPVVGFWLSGSYATFFHSEEWSWTFYRGATSYQGLLLVGAIYYGMMSLIWKNGFPRVATVVLANVGLWVMLTQTPGWQFLTHPQAWLIPPAVCVLLVAHLQRNELDTNVGSAIRYAATLMIYLSSTADMLLSEIGSSLWGPIVLILISLAGMLAGVALRVKPFLYLGTIFTFLGVVSMVWHAGQAIDAVWPWWVFGITTGLILLSILAGIEKHRDQLQRWSDRLATWS